MKLNSVDMEMEVDTGASVSIMSEEKFQQFQGSTSVTLQPSKAKLFTYTGEAIGVLGSTEVTVEHNQQVATLPLIVTKGTGPCLLGQNWLAKLRLDWQQIFSIRTGRMLQTVLDKYPNVFKDDLGTVKGLKAKIHVDPKATQAIPTLALGRIQRWALIWSAYIYTIQYKLAKKTQTRMH